MFNKKKYEIKNKKLLIIVDNKKKEIDFEFPIRQIIEFKDKYLVRLEPDIGKILNENVYCFDIKGQLLWQVEPIEYLREDSPYTNIWLSQNRVFLGNWCGIEVEVDPENGKVLFKKFTK